MLSFTYDSIKKKKKVASEFSLLASCRTLK